VQDKQIDPDPQHLQRRHQPLLDPVDEDTLHVSDVLDDPGHDVAGAAAVKPAQRQALDFGVKVGTDVEDDALLEAVVDEDAQHIQAVLGQKPEQGEADPEIELVVAAGIGDDFVDHMAGGIGKHEHRQGHPQRAAELRRGQTGVVAQIGKNTENRLHGTGERWLAAAGL